MATTLFTDGVTLTAAAWFNDVDSVTYPLTSVSGTNTVTASGPNSFSAYATGQFFRFVPAATNTAATTLNIGGAGAKNVFAWGAACAGGEIVSGVPCVVYYDGTQFNVINPRNPTVTNTLSGDVALNNTANFFDGPSCAQGTVGKWDCKGNVTLIDTSTGARFYVKLWDGTTVIASTVVDTTSINAVIPVTLCGVITNPAANIRMSVRDLSSTSGKILFNTSGAGADSTLTVKRI